MNLHKFPHKSVNQILTLLKYVFCLLASSLIHVWYIDMLTLFLFSPSYKAEWRQTCYDCLEPRPLVEPCPCAVRRWHWPHLLPRSPQSALCTWCKQLHKPRPKMSVEIPVFTWIFLMTQQDHTEQRDCRHFLLLLNSPKPCDIKNCTWFLQKK